MRTAVQACALELFRCRSPVWPFSRLESPLPCSLWCRGKGGVQGEAGKMTRAWSLLA
jgi:hypothetical protein